MAEEKRTILTAEGKKKEEEKLEYLKTVRRKEVSEAIAVARGFGDLSENAEYDAAKNEQAKLEAEIAELDQMLRTAIVQDVTDVGTDSVNIGTVVEIECVKTSNSDVFEVGETATYTIAGARESNPEQHIISNESAIGSALMGKKVGDDVDIELPSSNVTMKIVSIELADK